MGHLAWRILQATIETIATPTICSGIGKPDVGAEVALCPTHPLRGPV
jgi:hypothetical protein